MTATVDILDEQHLDVLRSIERRVLWLAVRIIDYANRERPKEDELKVGGHQASSTSMVSLMTALYFANLSAADRVSVKPHAAPILHAIEYLLGRLPREYLTRLRDYGGLQPYPSRTKDAFLVDYSTGSVGLGSVAPLFGALADQYVASHFGQGTGGRFISLIGDAELDEGSIWEAVLEPLNHGLGNALWIVDLNRQSLDRVIPGIRAESLERQFEAAGWQVLEIKYGRRLRAAYREDGGDILRRQIDEMPNQRYQALFAASDDVVAEALLDGLAQPDRSRLALLLERRQGNVRDLVQDLGGHDLSDVLAAFSQAGIDRRPTVIFAYTIKGYGLPIAGHPGNHSALLTEADIDALRHACGVTEASEWESFPPDSLEARLCAEVTERLLRPEPRARVAVAVPAFLSERDPPRTSTQAAFGKALLALSRVPDLAERLVTVSPDVSVSTNLGGWINKVGVWAPEKERSYEGHEESPLRWRVGPEGRHIELGISEMNMVLLIGQLGMTVDYSGEPLYPIGTLYDPFVARALEAMIYSVYSGARFVLAGTPSGISLSREGGAHQSTITPGIGIECPSLTYAEPCFARELEWLLLEGLRRLHEPDGEALYLRLSTKVIDQTPFAEAVMRRGEESLRTDVLSGGFRLREPSDGGDDAVILAACGALLPETLEAAALLEEEEGVAATVLALSSPDLIYRDWRSALLAPLRGSPVAEPHLKRLLLPSERGRPVVTVIDGASHSLAFLGGALGTKVVPLGVDRFGQVGSQQALYDAYDLSADAIVTAALVALEPS